MTLWWPQVDASTPSLAWGVIELAEESLRVPSGLGAGQPLRLTREQVEVLAAWYAVDARGRTFVHRRAMIQMAKGWAKSPIGALVAFGDLVGDVVPDGLDAAGEPVGRPHPSPWFQVAATSEDQTDNLYAQLFEMLRESPAVDGLRLDVGVTRIQFRDRPGRIEPVTSSAGAREGQPISGAVLEETHLWHRSNGGKALAATIRRNAAKMGARVMELTNAYDPGAGSVAEATKEAITSGRAGGALLVCREAPPVDDLGDVVALRAALAVAYGEAAADRGGWVDLDRLVAEAADTEPSEVRRYYLNQTVASEEAAVDMAKWVQMGNGDARLVEGDVVALGFDGSDSQAATALVAVRWPDWLVVPIAVWERPSEAKEWAVPRREVDVVLRQTLGRYRVVRGYFDPPHWGTEVDVWHGEFGPAVMRWSHASDSRIAEASERLETMVREGTLRHTGDPVLIRHLSNTRREKCRGGWRPAQRVQGRPIDCASATIGALQALGDAVAAGEVGTETVELTGGLMA